MVGEKAETRFGDTMLLCLSRSRVRVAGLRMLGRAESCLHCSFLAGDRRCHIIYIVRSASFYLRCF